MNSKNKAWSTNWYDLNDCRTTASQLASLIREPICIALSGTLGAGKTQFVRFFVEAFGGDASHVSSPTFVLVNLYQARLPVTHLDIYRLSNVIELDSIGFDDLVYGESVCVIEWADKFPQAIPHDALWIEIKPNEDHRIVHASAQADTIAELIIEQLAQESST